MFFSIKKVITMYGNYTIGGDKCDSRYHVCEVDYDVPPSYNFNDNIHFNRKLFFTLVTAEFILICIILIFNFIHKSILKYEDKFYNIFGIVSFIGLIILNFIIFLYSQKETCKIPHSCYEGKNNKLIPQFYFYQLDECPDEYNWLFYYYDNLFSPYVSDGHRACENTYYGCCKYYEEVQCIESYNSNLDYDIYKKTTGHWNLGVTMDDQNGTNCPTLSEIIYEVSLNKPLSNRINITEIDCILLITIILNMGLYFLCNLCSSKNYDELDEEDRNGDKEDKEDDEGDEGDEGDDDDDEEKVLRARA
jgi:hypothetical protein